mmetsp:Transcript_69442/g.130621  ORF Transcript_69442/g.130621 Transcript_69442/m.130621 type:complete len:311 (-) Transcript_69442:306-1238(-)
MPTRAPNLSATATPLRIFAMCFAASRTLTSGLTISLKSRFDKMPFRLLADPPNILSIRGPSISDIAFAFDGDIPFIPAVTFFAASLASDDPTFLPIASSFSILDIASYMHLAMSRTATMPPSLSSTGKCRKWLSIIMISASVASSSMRTHFGFAVITSDTGSDGLLSKATTLRMISVLVTMPARVESSPVSNTESVRAAAIAIDTSMIELELDNTTGGFGRSFETVPLVFFFLFAGAALVDLDCIDRGTLPRVPALRRDAVSDASSSPNSIVCSQNDRHPSLLLPSPIVAFITSIASTSPCTTSPPTTGR